MNKFFSTIVMLVATFATLSAQDLASVSNVVENTSNDATGFTLVPITPQVAQADSQMSCGIYLLDQSNDCVQQLTNKQVAYDKNNISVILMNILKPILIVGGDVMSVPKAREMVERFDKMFNTMDNIIGITSLLASGNINSERLVIQGKHATTIIPKAQTNECTFKFCLNGTPSDDPMVSYFKEKAKDPKNVKCIRLKSRNGGFRSFPKGLKLEAFGFTVIKDKKGGKMIDFDVIEQEGGDYKVKFPEPLEEGDYCFVCNDPTKDLFNGQLIVCDFTVTE